MVPAAPADWKRSRMPSPRTTFFFDATDADLARWRSLDPDREPHRLVLGEHYWIVLTWRRLADAGLDVVLDNRVSADGPVVFYAGDKRAVERAHVRARSRALLVATRSDRNPVGYADVEVVQNAASADGERCFHVPHWRQPGLIVRDGARGDRPRVLLFPGTRQNLHPGFLDGEWQGFLQARGLEMRCHFQATGDRPPAYHDLHDVDLMLAVRPSGATVVRNKPAWKLFNAWLAGVPALLGPEAGYRELREGPLDFIEVDGPAAARRAIERLLGEPGLYRGMVENGLQRGRDYDDSANVARWRVLIEEVLAPRAMEEARAPTPRWKRRLRDGAARLRRTLRGKA